VSEPSLAYSEVDGLLTDIVFVLAIYFDESVVVYNLLSKSDSSPRLLDKSLKCTHNVAVEVIWKEGEG